MPKKFVGENSKAVAARARKAAAKEAEHSRKAQEAEDKAWEDDDKTIQKKKQKQVSPLTSYLHIIIDMINNITVKDDNNYLSHE